MFFSQSFVMIYIIQKIKKGYRWKSVEDWCQIIKERINIMRKYKIAVVGATGVVGEMMRKVLEEK